MRKIEINDCFILFLGMFLFAELISLTGLISAPHTQIYLRLFSDLGLLVNGSLLAHAFLMKVFCNPTKKEMFVIVLFALFFAIFHTSNTNISQTEANLVNESFYYKLSIPLTGLGIASILVVIYRSFFLQDEHTNKNRMLFVGTIFIFFISTISFSYLELTTALHPTTYDFAAYKFDLSMGMDFSSQLATLSTIFPLLEDLNNRSYAILPHTISILYGLYVAKTEKIPINVLVVIFISTCGAIVLYHLIPVAGPKFAFWAMGQTDGVAQNLFPTNMPSLEVLESIAPQGFGITPPYIPFKDGVSLVPRNAIPSMHFGWALILWLISLRHSMPTKILFGSLLILTIISTLGLGEHYLIDLVIAVPLILFAFALCDNFSDRKKKYITLFWGLTLTIFWCLYIRFGFNYFAFFPGLSWLLVIGTLYICYLLFKNISIHPGNPVSEKIDFEKERFLSITRLPKPSTFLVCLVFFFSGFAALIYQVLFSKILSYTFGSNSSAIYTVLATYMGGMAIGAWLGGKIVRIKLPPLKTYALIETFIAIYCLLSPVIFDLVQNIYVSFGQGMQPGQINLEIFRFILGVIVLLIPTILMGITLPVLIQHFKFRRKNYGNSIAILYSSNTVGAAMGALISGYFIIPMIGVENTINIAVWINLLAAGIAYIYSNSQGYIHTNERLVDKTSVTQSNTTALIRTGFSFIVVMIIGFISLGLETVYVHMLAIVAGNSVYAFSLMLFTFLIGLGLGSELSRRLMKRNIELIYFICLLSILLTFTIFLTLFMWDQIPAYFASFENYPMAKSFAQREVIRGLICFLIMFPPAMIIGCLYPICLQYVSDVAQGIKIQAISSAIALNTVGNIFGVLVIGFVILPHYGAMTSIILLAILSLIISIYFTIFQKLKQQIPIGFLIALIIITYFNLPTNLNYNRLAKGSNVYFKEQNYGEVIAHHESLDGGLTTVHEVHMPNDRTTRTLLTNGKFQGNNNTEGEVIAQLGFGLVPLLHTKQRNDALVIGYGTGTTTKILYEAGFKNMDVVDISNDVFTLANKYFVGINGRVTEEENVKKFVTDGKNFLLLSNKTYDVISMEISSIWFAGAASLYNREFYQLVSKSLNQNGVLQQWVQLHHTTPYDLFHVIGTLRSEFKYVWLYIVGGQGILIAAHSENAFPAVENNALINQIPYLQNYIDTNTDPLALLDQSVFLTPKSIDRMFNEFSSKYATLPISDNDNGILEYSTPKSNVLDGNSYNQNIEWLKSFREGIP
jgi:spermidine synthase